MSIKVESIRKTFDGFSALENVTLDFPNGELVALLGPSGCGKTTLLRIIAGLENADSGRILLAGEDASSLHVRERQVGFVFQHYALFKHMNVFENVAFGLRIKPRKSRPSEVEIRKKVMELLDLVQLSATAHQSPAQLSGGQRQRIALARALAIEPRVLLLDEPFGALDAKVRKELRRWLRQLHDTLHITSVFVTHDQEEALELADSVVLMNKGKVEQVGSPRDVYASPASEFVYSFLGSSNLLEGSIDRNILHFGSGVIHLPEIFDKITDKNQDVKVYVRPHDLIINKEIKIGSIKARINRILEFNTSIRVELLNDDLKLPLEVELTNQDFLELDVKSGEIVYLTLKNVRIFT